MDIHVWNEGCKSTYILQKKLASILNNSTLNESMLLYDLVDTDEAIVYILCFPKVPTFCKTNMDCIYYYYLLVVDCTLIRREETTRLMRLTID